MTKKLIETDIPLQAINKESAREKSLRHGHPSTLHLWWARRPLAAARAVLWASLVDDPGNDADRRRLGDILAELVKWENTNNTELWDKARECLPDNLPELLDPFAGGGSIPLEGQRLGLSVHAHDLNPIAVMINKAMIDLPARFANSSPVHPDAQGHFIAAEQSGAKSLADDVEYYGGQLKDKAFAKLSHMYPKVQTPDGEATVIAWIWARTVKCSNPACGCTMPLVSSFMLSTKKGREAWAVPHVDGGTVTFTVATEGTPPDSPKIGRGKFRCVACGTTVGTNWLHEQFTAHNDGRVMIAVVAEGNNGRVYLSPDDEQVKAADVPLPDDFPDGELPDNPRWFSPPVYGMTNYASLFTNRQLTMMATFAELLPELRIEIEADARSAGRPDAEEYARAVSVYLAFVLNKLMDRSSSICSWDSSRDGIRNTFTRQAIPMVWDYAEANPFCSSSGSFDNMLDWVIEVIRNLLDHVFERVQSVWKPVTALEGFRIVKRRLFDFEGVDNSEIERTAEVFSRMYQSNTADFPAESRELGYKERIAENYPIHPEIFDRLYGEWSTLENFQRTRGVLQLLAGVVHDLWESGDTSPLIMPGSIAYSEKEASRITVYLPGSDAWSPIIDTEVDGQDSLPRKQDAKYHRGCSEGVRLARTILLGSAPSTKAQNVRGIERERIFLGSVLAGENISVFRDGLNELRETLSYLYVSDKDGRYWFDTRPTLRRTVRNRAAQQTREQVEGEIFRRLKRVKRGEFGNVHVWPKSEDVADSQSVQLVILSPKEGEADAAEIVRTCGHSARTYRNTLLFVEADAVKLEELTGTVRTYLGWQSVNEDHETLNLTRSQTGEAKRNSEEYSRKVDAAILDAWSVVLVPQCLDGRKIDAVTWKRERAANGGSLWERVFYALSADELSRNMKAEPLRMELDNLMWKNSDDIEIKTLWEDLCRFCYLPRVLNFGVLAGAILSGMRDGEYFALAHGKDGATYDGLTLNAPYSVEMTDYLVKREVAEKLITPPEPPKTPKVGTTTEQEQDTKPIDATPKPKAIHNFSMSAELREDPTPAKYFMKLYNDIIAVLQQDVSGATFDLTLEVNMHAADPIPNDTRKIVTDNCKAHKVNDYSFY